MRKLQLKLVLLLILSSLSVSAYAAVNPVGAGRTSDGSFDLSLNLNPEVQITGLKDVGVMWDTDSDATSNPGASMQRSVDFCVYSSVGSYAITMTSANGINTKTHTGNGNFKLLKTGQSLSEDALYSYSMNFTDSNKTVTDVQSGRKYTDFTGATSKTFCATGTNAKLDVYIRPNTYAPLSTGVYSDILSITVTPE